MFGAQKNQLAEVQSIVIEAISAMRNIEAYCSYLLTEPGNQHFRDLSVRLIDSLKPKMERALQLFDTIYTEVQSPRFFVAAAYYNSEAGARLSAIPLHLERLSANFPADPDVKALHHDIGSLYGQLCIIKDMLNSIMTVYKSATNE